MREITNHLQNILTAQAPTSEVRAAEIARMDSFGIIEFLELTGIEPGGYGIYNVDTNGVRIRLSVDDPTLTAPQRIALRDARVKHRELDFPCTPGDFCDWYETTRGENQISDFPLADGFLNVLGKKRPMCGTSNADAAPSTKIMAAFEVMPDPEQNTRWWSDRMRSAQKYGLLRARASQGGRGRGKPSYWHPLSIACWLIEKNHLTKYKVIKALTEHFPECDFDYLQDV
ncbi:MAG: hypothetical protein IPF44_10640 [Betaproteobacteria bacterium]|nr:hypothetical protein [Betaproteobacteria bacterium]